MCCISCLKWSENNYDVFVYFKLDCIMKKHRSIYGSAQLNSMDFIDSAGKSFTCILN